MTAAAHTLDWDSTIDENSEPVQISVFKSVTAKFGQLAEIRTILARIRGDDWRESVEQVRAAYKSGGKPAADQLKKRLPAVTFAGKFNGPHKTESLEAHSGNAVLDFDNLNGRLAEVRTKLARDQYCHAVFISPSGTGLKFLMKIPPVATEHGRAFDAAAAYFKKNYDLTADKSGRDVSRLCFVSHDPDLFHNPEAAVFPTPPAPKIDKRPIPTHSLGDHPDREKVLDALRHISADCSFDDWLRIGMALQAWSPDEGRAMWDSWSRTAPDRYQEAAIGQHWKSFKPGAVTIATLFKQAIDAGWSTPRKTLAQSYAPTIKPNMTPATFRAKLEAQDAPGVKAKEEPSDPDTEIIVTRSLTDFADAAIDEGKTLLAQRFLCCGGGMLFIGPSGSGKSSGSVQQDIQWSLGKPAFGICPARPLRITTIQAENDDGDLTEMSRGIMAGLKLTPTEREQVRANTFYVSERTRTGPAFIRFVASVLQLTKPDLLRLDPLQSYLGGDVSDPPTICAFVHNGLNPLLEAYNCACIINHHTPKTTNRDSSQWRTSDWQYAGAGAATLTNWARGILVVDPCDGNPHLFRFIAAKRGYRIGWKTEAGDPTIIRHFKHAREEGVIFWTDAQPDEIASGSKAQHSKDDILGLVPPDAPISRDTLLSKASVAGIGVNKARRFINELVDAGSLHTWRIPRPRTNPRIDLARVPQPEPRLDV